MFITASEVVARIETLFSSEVESLTLTDAQKEIVTQCTEDAYWTIVSALTSRHGLTKAQADAWPLGKRFQRDIAFFWSVKSLGFYKPAEPGRANPLDKYNREGELLRPDLPLVNASGEALADRDSPGFAVVDLPDDQVTG